MLHIIFRHEEKARHRPERTAGATDRLAALAANYDPQSRRRPTQHKGNEEITLSRSIEFASARCMYVAATSD